MSHQRDRSRLDFINVHEQCKINYFNLFTMLTTMISMFMGSVHVQQSRPFMDKLNRPMHILMVMTNIIRSTNGLSVFHEQKDICYEMYQTLLMAMIVLQTLLAFMEGYAY